MGYSLSLHENVDSELDGPHDILGYPIFHIYIHIYTYIHKFVYGGLFMEYPREIEAFDHVSTPDGIRRR